MIICCYNSEKMLPKTLEAIAVQEVPASLKWEVIIVNNNSTDGTKGTAYEIWSRLGCAVRFQVVEEETPGLSAAREKGFEVAQFEFCLFCDDDNWLEPRYLSRAFEVLSRDSKIGVLGGRGIEVCETLPPKWFEAYKGGYAIGSQSDRSGDVTDIRGFVYGAAAIFRKSGYLKLKRKGFRSLLTDRKGETLSSGGDKELSYAFVLAGYRIYYLHENTFQHFIPKRKINKQFVAQLFLGFAAAQPVLTLYEYAISDRRLGRNERNTSSMWIKDVVRSVYSLIRAIGFGILRFRMQLKVLSGVLRLRRTYAEKFIQISSLQDSGTQSYAQ